MKRLLTSLVMCLAVGSVSAKIEAPDHVLYGSVSLFGNPVPEGQLIELRLVSTGEVLARYRLGSSDRLGSLYALRIPMDTVEPRPAGRGRPGDPIKVFIGDALAGETTIGAEGRAVRLDLDPQNLATGPSLEITDVEVFEGNGGTTPVVFDVSLNTTDPDDVILFWRTRDNGATGGALCSPGVDYIAEDDQQLIFSPGEMQKTITLQVCGDSVIEPLERFFLDIIGVQNGVPSRDAAVATIIDDDNVPELRVADVSVIEPSSGQTAAAVFRPRLSRNSDFEARISYRTEPLNAVPGVDYTPVQGTVSIAAGDLEAVVPVPILNAPGALPPRSFHMIFENPFNLTVTDDRALGLIIDRAFRPAALVEQQVVNGRDVTGLADPTAIALSPDGEHAYVVSESLDTLAVFRRNSGADALAFSASYSAATTGFEDALLDGALDVVVSPDGLNVYVAARTADAISVFARNPATGALSFVQNQVDSEMSTPESTVPNAGLRGVRQLLVSADGEQVYAVGAASNGLAVFARDGTTGALEFLEAEVTGVDDPQDSGGTVVAMTGPSGLVEAPDGAQIYVASRLGNAVQVFARDTDSSSEDFGRLSYVTALRDGLDGISGLRGAFDLVLSPGGEQLYVSAESENAVTIFDRDASGALSLRTTIEGATQDVPGLVGPQGIAMAPDGLEVFVTGFGDDSLTIFRRLTEAEDGLEPGDLVVRQTMFDDQGSVLFMAGPTDVEASGDNEYVYVVANEDNAILVLRRISLDVIFFDGFETR
ncbi:beta-propeller fold lactonase family protein [Wenzhouxiangella sp. XN79A]|uniref:beta-propeller fold lactonase family protein n=1 Tax=Wenzhouxiangella sp. XN79A TaxID=2724193 RepID=UPI00144AEF61|nr:beta-propeller fold lactonase family protein [Wenzhouxiangella sp. XN79A]NKI35647.1 beta-propeller fold lactonase family protein [Wenzhouxiangella sp. XN79A]